MQPLEVKLFTHYIDTKGPEPICVWVHIKPIIIVFCLKKKIKTEL